MRTFCKLSFAVWPFLFVIFLGNYGSFLFCMMKENERSAVRIQAVPLANGLPAAIMLRLAKDHYLGNNGPVNYEQACILYDKVIYNAEDSKLEDRAEELLRQMYNEGLVSNRKIAYKVQLIENIAAMIRETLIEVRQQKRQNTMPSADMQEMSTLEEVRARVGISLKKLCENNNADYEKMCKLFRYWMPSENKKAADNQVAEYSQKQEEERLGDGKQKGEANTKSKADESERKRREDDARKRHEEEIAKKKAGEEAAARKKAEEEARLKVAADEAESKRREDDARKRHEEEIGKKKVAEEAAARKKAEEETRLKVAVDEAQSKRKKDEARKRYEEEIAKKKAAEEEAARKKAEEEARLKVAADEEERKRKKDKEEKANNEKTRDKIDENVANELIRRGDACRYGKGVPVDNDAAKRCYEAVAHQGRNQIARLKALCRLATHFPNDQSRSVLVVQPGVRPLPTTLSNTDKAIESCMIAINQTNDLRLQAYGRLYLGKNFHGKVQNQIIHLTQAAHLLVDTKVCAKAFYHLGCYYLGLDNEQGKQNALENFEKASTQNDHLKIQTKAKYKLGILYNERKNFELAERYFADVAQQEGPFQIAARNQLEVLKKRRNEKEEDASDTGKQAVEAFIWFAEATEHFFGHNLRSIDLEAARIYYEKAANQQHNLYVRALAHFRLGEIYDLGYGVPVNKREALKYYKGAIKSECELWPEALSRMGIIYYFGLAGEIDYESALKCFEMVANQDSNLFAQAAAWYRLAEANHYGYGMSPHHRTALELYEKVVNQEENRDIHPHARVALGILYSRGVRIDPDYNRALFNFHKAYQQEDSVQIQAQACCELARLYRMGLGVPLSEKSFNTALELFVWAATHEQYSQEMRTYASQNLEEMKREGYSLKNLGSVKKEDVVLDREAQKRREKTDSESAALLEKYRRESLDKDPKIRLNAYIWLGSIYFFGRGVPINYKEAKKCYKRAAFQNDDLEIQAAALVHLAFMYKSGKGCSIKRNKAIDYFALAAVQDVNLKIKQQACFYLARMLSVESEKPDLNGAEICYKLVTHLQGDVNMKEEAIRWLKEESPSKSVNTNDSYIALHAHVSNFSKQFRAIFESKIKSIQQKDRQAAQPKANIPQTNRLEPDTAKAAIKRSKVDRAEAARIAQERAEAAAKKHQGALKRVEEIIRARKEAEEEEAEEERETQRQMQSDSKCQSANDLQSPNEKKVDKEKPFDNDKSTTLKSSVAIPVKVSGSGARRKKTRVTLKERQERAEARAATTAVEFERMEQKAVERERLEQSDAPTPQAVPASDPKGMGEKPESPATKRKASAPDSVFKHIADAAVAKKGSLRNAGKQAKK